MNKNRSIEKLSLFQDLKCTVERILTQYSHDVWSVYGGLQSMILSLDAIFQHGVKPQTGLVGLVIDYWLFIRGLRWLDPTLATDIDNLSKLPAASPVKPQQLSITSVCPKRVQLSHGEQWIEKSLKSRNISKQISTLLSDANHLKDHYFDWAFLSDDFYTSAALICISAIEQNSPALLGNLPQSLFTKRPSSQKNIRFHRTHTAGSGDESNEHSINIDGKKSGSLPLCPPDTPPIDIPSSAQDPLNVSLKPLTLSSSKSQSFTGRYPAGAGTDSTENLNAASSPHSNHPPSHRLATSAPRTKSARKPLFDSSDDDNCDSDKFGFLSTSEAPNAGVVGTFYSTVEIIPDLENSSSMFTSCDYASEPDSALSVAVLLPDLVISAQNSRSLNLDPASGNNREKEEISTQAEQVQTDSNLNKSSTTVVRKFHKPTHRRSRSDRSHEITRLKYTELDGPACCGDDMSFMRKKSLQRVTSFTYGSSLEPSSPGPSSSRSTSLINYLKNQDLTTCADIVKENAHFDFSEILIATIEQVKCQMREHGRHEAEEKDLDDEFEDVTNHPVSVGYQSPVGSFISSEVMSSSVHSSASQSGLPAEFEKLSLVSSGELSSKKSTFSESSSRTESTRTAESIAIGLLQAFSDQRRATAGELEWLISEEDVPQKLLPIPESTVVDPDFFEDQGIRIRGNQDWAPPRPQIIFRAPVKLKLKAAMAKQNNRCAGCGTYVEKEFMKRFRYCEYTGKYFCTCCHDNKLSVLPANVLERFDFTKCKVSNFSHDLLQKIPASPLYDIDHINPSLYKKAKILVTVKEHRTQIISLYKYLQLCRIVNNDSDKNGLKHTIVSLLPFHMLDDPVSLYSLQDFDRAKSGELLADLKLAIELASSHVSSCELCRLKGFLCEVCHSEEIIFPHQTSSSTCALCKSCFHKKCFNPRKCPKCARLRRRKEALDGISEE